MNKGSRVTWRNKGRHGRGTIVRILPVWPDAPNFFDRFAMALVDVDADCGAAFRDWRDFGRPIFLDMLTALEEP